MIGLKKAKELQKNLTNEAIQSLSIFGENSSMLIELCKYLLVRQK